MTPTEELMAARVRELVEGAAHEPWDFSPAEARRLAGRRHRLAAVTHLSRRTALLAAIVVSVVAVGTLAAVLAAGPSRPPRPSSATDVVVAGVFREIGGPQPGYENLSGTIRFAPASGRGPTLDTPAVGGRWRIEVPPGTYFVSGKSPFFGHAVNPRRIVVRPGRAIDSVVVAYNIR